MQLTVLLADSACTRSLATPLAEELWAAFGEEEVFRPGLGREVRAQQSPSEHSWTWDTASETDRGQFDEREYSTEVVYFGFWLWLCLWRESGFKQGQEGPEVWQKWEGEVGHQSAPTSRGLRGDYGLVSTRVPEAKPSKKPPRGCWGGMPKILFNRYYCSTIRRCHNKTAYSYQMLFFPHVFNLLKL